MTASAPRPAFLILHGWQNRRPEDHWQHRLADRLTATGHRVGYPQLPDPDRPELDRWLSELDRHLAELNTHDGERVVLCHSLACLLWLHAAARAGGRLPADRVLLVAPPAPEVLLGVPEIAGFAPPPLAPGLLAGTRIVEGEGDPYCPGGVAEPYGRPLGLPVAPESPPRRASRTGHGSASRGPFATAQVQPDPANAPRLVEAFDLVTA